MKRTGIIGGETHIGEVTALHGHRLEVSGACAGKDTARANLESLGCPILSSVDDLLATGLDIVAIANENDARAEAVIPALERGCDVIVDKPLCLSTEDQDRIEVLLAANASQRLLMLLTLRGEPTYAGLRNVVLEGRIGDPVFTHVRMAVRLKRDDRPAWFLDSARSGGLFLDLLIHGLDYLEWMTGRDVVSITAQTGNLANPDDAAIRDHASAYCQLNDGSTALVEGQRMLPDSKGSDYRVHVAGTRGVADLDLVAGSVHITDPGGADTPALLPHERTSVVLDWLDNGNLVPQNASLRANALALAATASANMGATVRLGDE